MINYNGQQPRIWVVDEFYSDPDRVRDFALNVEYIEGGVGRGFIGRRTKEQYLFPGLKSQFEKIMGRSISVWEDYDMNGRFQSCWAGEPLVYHCDAQKWAGMIYLTPDAPPECGTTTWRHKESKVRHGDEPNIMDAFIDETKLDRTMYEPVDVIGNVYNRLVIFDAQCIHSASEYFGYDLLHSRLWQMFFFD